MALHRSVLKEDDILCELHVDRRSDITENSEMKFWTVAVTFPPLDHVDNCDLLP